MSWLVRAPNYADLLPGARRFYAKLAAFSLECPKCGEVTRVRTKRGGYQGWKPLLSHWTCRYCGRKFHLGIVAWPIGVHGIQGGLPTDTLPTEEQSIALGHLMDRTRRGREGVNVVVENQDEEPDQ